MNKEKILVKCPNCGAQGWGKKSMTEKPTKCPKCGKVNTFLHVNPEDKIITNENIKMPSGFGITSFNFGLLAILVCWIPFIGVISIPLSIIAIILGSIGIVLSIKLKKTNKGFAITGSSLAVAAIIITVITTSKATNSIKDSINSLFDSSINSNVTETLDSDLDETEKIEWQSALNDIIHEKVKIDITSCVIGKVPLKGLFGDNKISKNNLLMIKLSVTNLNKNNKLNYTSWSGGDFSLSEDTATLRDNFNNIYRPVNFGYSTNIVGRTDDVSIYPNQSIQDILVFEKPIDTIQKLKLKLPADNINGHNKIYIEIPREMIKGL